MMTKYGKKHYPVPEKTSHLSFPNGDNLCTYKKILNVIKHVYSTRIHEKYAHSHSMEGGGEESAVGGSQVHAAGLLACWHHVYPGCIDPGSSDMKEWGAWERVKGGGDN